MKKREENSADGKSTFAWRPCHGVPLSTLVLFCVLIFAGTRSVRSYVLSTGGGHILKWPVNTSIVLPLQLGTNGQGTLLDGSANYDVVAAQAASLWNGSLGSNVRLITTLNGVGPGGAAYHDNSAGLPANQVFFSNTINGMAFGSGVLAVTTTTFRGGTGEILAAVVTFNKTVQWNSFRGARTGAQFDLRRVAAHEFGHVLGLNHPDPTPALMDAIYSDTIQVPQLDDINGVQADYGPNNPLPNLISVAREIGGARLRWQENFPGAIYRVQASDDLLSGCQELNGTVTADGNGLIDFLDPISAASTRQFYRLIPPP